ncbi:TetR/AcrR family transcriptional regulator [Isoalcanivorax beigongshangi]|uniref:TetR/AcrR family transcriptional regulator n=1 Tax=Isoalcanivorax beigongshangi TaxID=3238810 RepID=A0ABV4AH77_9GAMM
MGDLEKAARKAQEFRQREREILDAALALFLEHGEDRVTVEMIADQVGIGKGTIYKHFETKNEIYLLLMIRYEEDLAELFRSIDGEDDRERLPREYFSFRIQQPRRYQLFDRLENKVIKEQAVPELVDKLHTIRAKNLDSLVRTIEQGMKADTLEPVPPYYHIALAWALAHGAVGLMESPFYQKYIDDKEDFTDFLINVGIRMGNKGQRGRRDD